MSITAGPTTRLGAEIDGGWASCAITENGFVRIISQPRYPSPIAPAQAIALLRPRLRRRSSRVPGPRPQPARPGDRGPVAPARSASGHRRVPPRAGHRARRPLHHIRSALAVCGARCLRGPPDGWESARPFAAEDRTCRLRRTPPVATRPRPDRHAAPRQPAHRAAGVAVRPLGGRAVCHAHRGPRRGPGGRARRAAARRPRRARPRLGRARRASVRAPGGSTTRRSRASSRRPLLPLLLHARGDPRGRVGAARSAPRRALPGHLPRDYGRPARRARTRRAPARAAGAAGAPRRRASPTGCRPLRGDRRRPRRAPQRRRPAYNLAVVVDDALEASARWCVATTCSRPRSASCTPASLLGAIRPHLRARRARARRRRRPSGQARRRGHAGRPGRRSASARRRCAASSPARRARRTGRDALARRPADPLRSIRPAYRTDGAHLNATNAALRTDRRRRARDRRGRRDCSSTRASWASASRSS